MEIISSTSSTFNLCPISRTLKYLGCMKTPTLPIRHKNPTKSWIQSSESSQESQPLQEERLQIKSWLKWQNNLWNKSLNCWSKQKETKSISSPTKKAICIHCRLCYSKKWPSLTISSKQSTKLWESWKKQFKGWQLCPKTSTKCILLSKTMPSQVSGKRSHMLLWSL